MVALSPSQHATVKRLFLNVLSGDDRFLSCNRAALQEQQIPQRFLIERGWAIRGNKMTFTLSMDKARQFLQELQATNGPVPGPVAAAAPVPSEAGKAALPEVVARVKAAIQREEKVGLFRSSSFTLCLTLRSASRRVVVSLCVPLLCGRVWAHDVAGR